MSDLLKYIAQFGDRTFDDVPFGDADNLALCEIFYLPFEHVISDSFDAEPVPFDDASRALFALRGNRHRRVGLVLSKESSREMMAMRTTPRFSQIKLWAARSAFARPALQFGCMTALLPDGTAVIVFRGTDDTLAGWHEDLDLYLNDGMMSYPLAEAYLKEAAARLDGDLIICGHSKGGNLALYTALTADEATRKRIKAVYNNDGPGFRKYRRYETGVYDELLPRYRHLVPSASMLGMMLAHDYDYTVVKNRRIVGLLQHDLTFWRVQDGAVATRDDLWGFAKFTDLLLANLIFRIRDEHCEILDFTANQFLDGAKVETLTEAIKILPVVAVRVLGAWCGMEKDKRTLFRRTLHGVTDITVRTALRFRKGDVPAAPSEAGMLRKPGRPVVTVARRQFGQSVEPVPVNA